MSTAESIAVPFSQSLRNPLELWGGFECTINRIGDRFHNQLAKRSISDRLQDLERIAALGIRTLRFPLLWEEVMPHAGGPCNWAWADAGLDCLRRLNIRPIVGLVHHGSGPDYTDLLDPLFARKLSYYAGRVAARYPWVDAYTPVNEPLTTARFSGLYGLWYPHKKSPSTFCQSLLNQLRATGLSMNAIRRVNPGAQLVQTEDMGMTFSPLKLNYQAKFENERRWASFDLLTGRMDRAGPFWGYLLDAGIKEAVLEEIMANPCPPDLVGINHYVTSNRYLDPNTQAHPPLRRGGNGKDAYADIEAVRSPKCDFLEPVDLLRAIWERYHLPIAITEAHLACTREEQMRWFGELWRAAQIARKSPIPVVAVTAWSLFGAFDWDSLLVRHEGHYEAGAFDLRSPEPRQTAMAALIGRTIQN